MTTQKQQSINLDNNLSAIAELALSNRLSKGGTMNMDNRKNKSDRRDTQAKAWDAIMADVKKHTDTANRVDKCLDDLRVIVDRWASMSTTKG